MRISKKCYYALRAAFELASRSAGGPVPVQEIAVAQGKKQHDKRDSIRKREQEAEARAAIGRSLRT